MALKIQLVQFKFDILYIMEINYFIQNDLSYLVTEKNHNSNR